MTDRNSAVDAYNDDLAECLHQALTGVRPWEHQTPRVLMSDLLPANDNPANDNLPEQMSFDF